MDTWFIQAFLWLQTDRLHPRGPIPWSARMLYADTFGLRMDTAQMFCLVISKLDTAYWEFAEKQAEKEKQASGTNTKPKSRL